MSYTENTTSAPGPEARSGAGRMSDDELKRIMHNLVADAEALVDGELSPKRATARDYYFGRPFGNEEEGRSQVVITEVRDTIHGILPSMMRMFFGPERAVEFVPRRFRPDVNQAALAQQATDYVNYVFVEDNGGFLKSYSVFKDGFVGKIGIFKYWWEKDAPRADSASGITKEAMEQLLGPDGVEPTDVKENEDGTYDVEYTIASDEGRVCVAAIPPEEFIFNRGARDPEEATMLGHRTRKKRGDLIAMGISEKVLKEHGSDDEKLEANQEAYERTNYVASSSDEPESGEANDDILYTECYVRIDVDGDGYAEMRRVCMIGTGHHVVSNEPVDDRPFALFCPIPEPHTLIGQSYSDLTMDLQLVKSSLVRSMNDSLALSIYPRMGFVEGLVNVEDLLNTEIGAPIRMLKEQAVQPISHPFTGEAAMPIVQYFDDVSESRTGRSKGTMLDSDALQSSTKQAVDAAVTASNEQMELLARIFAEMTLKPLFRGIYRLLVKYKPAERLVKLRGTYIPISTADWDADMDVRVNVAIGMSNVDRKIQTLMGIKETQEAILANYGPQNPLVHLSKYRETLARLTELGGYPDVSAFWDEVDPNWQPPQQPPQMTPEQTLAQAQLQIEQMKTQKDLAIKQAELQLKQQQQQFEQDLEIRKLAMDFTLRRYQIDAQFQANYTQANLELDAAHEEAALKGVMDARRMEHERAQADREHALAVNQQQHEQEMARDAQAHEQTMAERSQAADEAAAQQAATQSETE